MQKMKDDKGKKLYSIKKLLFYLAPYKLYLTVAVVCMALFGASEGVIPVLLRYVLDEVFQSHNQSLLYTLPFILIGFALFRALTDFGQRFTMAYISHNLVKDIREQLSSKILKLSPSYFLYAGTGNLLSRLTSDVALVKNLLTESLVSLIRDTIRVIALVVAALYLDWKLAVLGVVIFPFGMLPVYFFGTWVRKYARKAQSYLGKLSSLFAEMIQGIKVIKIFNQEELEREKFSRENKKITSFFIKSDFARSLSGPVNEVLASIAISLVLLYGGQSVIAGTRSAGQFMAFLAALFLLYDPFKKLGRVYTQFQQGLSGADRLYEVLNAKEEPQELALKETPIKEYSIKFKEVSFYYSVEDNTKKKHTPALLDINLFIPEGSKVAIVGQSGAGKTTLVYLIARFIEPTKGDIFIGDTNLKDINISYLH
ncbi:MAG: ABC transporter ATP-binding protein [Candidatus Dadabacteria bacterium]|nr:MAG: ABC transporter ATP-binding protein [Candidatus Dadabacteria bacterium]